jgi:hypothetical protein
MAIGASDYITSGPRDTRQKRRKVVGKGKQLMVQEEEEEWQDSSGNDDEDVSFGNKFCDSSESG